MEEEDSYSSSGDESSTKQGTLKTDVQEDADKQMENSLEDEQNKVIAISQTLLKEEDTMKCIHKFNLMNSFSNSHFQDILPQIVDGKIFLIDGDSLVLYALSNKGLSIEAGGTMLHITYIVERFLLTFVSRGLNFIVVFFEIWNRGWSFFPQFSIARNAVKLHLLYNQKIFPVLIMDYLWSNEFLSLLHIQRPGFIVMSTTIPKLQDMTTMAISKEKTAELWLQFLCDSQRVCCDMAFLDVVDIASISSSHVSLMGMVHIHSNRYTRVHNDITTLICRIVELMPIQKKVENLKPIDFPEGDIKIMAIVAASALTLNKNLTILTEDVIKTILLCTATAEVTPLKRRCFKKLRKLPRGVIEVIRNFQEELAGLLSTAPTKSKSIDFKSVGDMWQGRLFNAVYNFVHKASIFEKCNLESVIALRYELLVSYLNKLMLKKKLQAFPIKSAFKDPAVEGSVKTLLDQPFSPPKPQLLLPSTCELELLFCGQIASDTPLLKYTEIEDVEGADFLHEWRHWHSKVKLTDEGERILDIDKASEPQKYVPNPRHAQSMRNKYARYLTLYGSSIEGRCIAPKAIVVSEVKKNSQTSEKKESKLKDRRKPNFSKKDAIIYENTKRILEQKRGQIQERIKNFSKIFSCLMLGAKYSEAIEKSNIELQHAKDFSELTLEILLMKGQACYGLWKDECHKPVLARNMKSCKDLFLVIRDIFIIADKNDQAMNVKQKDVLSAWLHCLGFKDLAKTKGLPEPDKGTDPSHSIGLNHIEFQLSHLGADLIRDTGGEPDPRAEGFIPDPWQVELFDIIDKKQCAVVVAPTSSGKTYASYYCMEKVLRNSDNDIVVYVCPTKALVNQVVATIYARFKKNLPPGKALLGVFTRDYQNNLMNCQILVTVPECMELLLLSPRCLTWSMRIKYFIFDEVHCLVGQSGGVAWENAILLIHCPFLALSATIHKPESFCDWLQKVENFKKAQAEKYGLSDRSPNSYKVNLVEHSDRHNHLLKNVMMEDGSIQHVHPYSFLDLANERVSVDIPEHIALSPDETLDLYKAMQDVLPKEKLKTVCFVKYFEENCPSGYLTMQSVKQYSSVLRTLLEKEDQESKVRVLQILKPVDYASLNVGSQYILHNIHKLVKNLKKKQMLPALVFSYSRLVVQALPLKLLRYLRSLDDFPEDESETDDGDDSDSDNCKKPNSNKQNRRTRGKRYTKKLGLMRGPSALKSEGSLRGEGNVDEKMIEFLEYRLMSCGHNSQDIFPSMLRRGLGTHHGGMNNKERGAVEMLFRSKMLNVVAATGTLALGIHMPCKTVVVAGDSPYLNALEFHQMSGRAGRRGFDTVGNVVLFGLNKRKMQSLMTGRPPEMIGNFPLCASLILRLLLLVTDSTTGEASNAAMARAYTLLENSLIYQSHPQLKDKMKYYFCFVVQFLRQQRLLSVDGHLHAHALLITHLHYHEPGNFAFYYLLQSGILEAMCDCDKSGEVSNSSIFKLLTVLNFLFARIPVSKHLLKRKRLNSIVVLPPLPDIVQKGLESYNSQVMSVFSSYHKCMSAHIEKTLGKETNLPLSQLCMEANKPLLEDLSESENISSFLNRLHSDNEVCSVFAGLSGNTDEDLFPVSGEISHIRDELDVKIVPTLELDFECNSYAVDFYKHGIAQAMSEDNGLKAGEDYKLLRDFMLALKCLQVSLSEILDPSSKLLHAFQRIDKTFTRNFNRAYYGSAGV